MSDSRKVTRKDIAAAANVSFSTVGMILSGRGENYNENTRQLVEETAKRLGYQPSINARALRLQRSLLIGVLLNEVNSDISAQFLLGVQKSLAPTDYSPIVFFTKAETDQNFSFDTCLNRQVDALILNCSVEETKGEPFQAFATRVGNLSIPVIEVFGRFIPSVSSVNVDNYSAGHIATEHLASLGHKRIALVTHERYTRQNLHLDAWEQYTGYCDALTERGLEPMIVTPKLDFDNVANTSFVQAGHASLALLQASPSPPTAALCYNDFMAMGINRACREQNISVPRDFSISGNNDTVLSSVINPSLTTICADYFEVGRHAANLVLGAIQGKETSNHLVKPSLISRASTAAPRE